MLRNRQDQQVTSTAVFSSPLWMSLEKIYLHPVYSKRPLLQHLSFRREGEGLIGDTLWMQMLTKYPSSVILDSLNLCSRISPMPTSTEMIWRDWVMRTLSSYSGSHRWVLSTSCIHRTTLSASLEPWTFNTKTLTSRQRTSVKKSSDTIPSSLISKKRTKSNQRP